ncbi:uncharacterized protein TrAtP1_001055 [Trichoderma atroviride]|uniref:uncharacterized protein n=1 Tax=Hypocrea atroviridis TaxID=63577 RepID=UPI00332EFABB|nr:hypothetical protein TrAtP1_001055 [Trichoderma atroviride]
MVARPGDIRAYRQRPQQPPEILKNADSPGTRCERIAEKGSRRNEVCENGAGAEAEAVTIA